MKQPGHSGDQPFIGMAADVDTLVIGTSPSQSYALLDAVMTEAVGLAMYNAVAAQQNASAARNAAVLMACAALLSLPVAALPASAAQASSRAAAEPQAASAGKKSVPAGAPERPATVQSAGESVQADASAAPGADRRMVDPQVVDAINQIQKAVLNQETVRTSGAGKAYQLVAQSAAIAVQDATDALRGVSIIAATAAGVAMTRFLASGDPKFLLGLTAARDMMTTATDDFARIAAASARAVTEFPTG